MINLDDDDLLQVKEILALHIPNCKVIAFGSRVNGTNQKYSDLDLAIIGKQALDLKIISNLKDAFSASDLPILIDIVDWHKTSPSFQKIIQNQCEIIQQENN